MNNMRRSESKRSIGVVLILTAMLIVSVCSITSNLFPAKAAPSNLRQAAAILNHAPAGTAGLLWSQTNNTLVVTVTVIGLVPGSTHPDAIHNGTNGGCGSPTHGDVIYGLNAVIADGSGNGMSTTTIQNVPMGIPAQGWYIDIHNGPQLADNGQQERIACANITNPKALISAPPSTNLSNPPTTNKTNEKPTTNGTITTDGPSSPSPSIIPSITSSITNNQVVNVTLGNAADNNQSITGGEAKLSINRSNPQQPSLVVKIFIFGLTPNSTHIAHIHQGSCKVQGPIIHTLNAVNADSVGFGTATTTIANVSSIPDTSWYVNIHQGSTTNSMSTQTDLDLIACGNISQSGISIATSTPLPVVPSPTTFIE